MQTPTVGRIVHYHPSPGSPPEAGIVIGVNADTVNLQVCNSGGTWSTKTSVPEFKEGGEGAFWAWPPRV